ncbi:MAG: MBOAT family protein [Planctomycetes bacterium]|nr:MBOAT family protein [Planctomycetota bacterium]
MLFNEARFFVFFALAFAVHWALRTNGSRKAWLLLCSCAFYGAWDWRFLGLMAVSILIDYATGRALTTVSTTGARRAWLVLSLCANLGILGFFKYYGFFVDSATELLKSLGFETSERTLQIVLPVGISFFTFQSMSYTIDVYRRGIEAVKSFTDFALFVAFFPQLVAGPIVRAVDFIPQLATKRLWRDVEVRACLVLFLAGFIKKACIADNIAPTLDSVFKDPSAFDAASNWIALALYHVQIYCDFSGYSDMAIAAAGLLGYKLTLNFNFPYLTSNIAEWWRRWHISLSSWFRDYLYIPLGGNRRGSWRTFFNLYVVFLLCGLWHGANWNFLAWGAFHGTLLAVHRAWGDRHAPQQAGSAVVLAKWCATTLAVLWGWLIFRGEGATKTLAMFEIQLGLEPGGTNHLDLWWVAFFASALLVHVLANRAVLREPIERVSNATFAVVYGCAWALTLPWLASGYTPFIYFQF